MVRACGPSERGDQGHSGGGKGRWRSRKILYSLPASSCLYLQLSSQKKGLPGSTWNKKNRSSVEEGRDDIVAHTWSVQSWMPCSLLLSKAPLLLVPKCGPVLQSLEDSFSKQDRWGCHPARSGLSFTSISPIPDSPTQTLKKPSLIQMPQP